MSKRKAYGIFLSSDDRIDVDLEFEKEPGERPRMRRFSLTYSARIGGRWWEVVRYDNFHGYLHRQRFWRSGEPERIPAYERLPPEVLVEKCQVDLRRNWERYRRLREVSIRGE